MQNPRCAVAILYMYIILETWKQERRVSDQEGRIIIIIIFFIMFCFFDFTRGHVKISRVYIKNGCAIFRPSWRTVLAQEFSIENRQISPAIFPRLSRTERPEEQETSRNTGIGRNSAAVNKKKKVKKKKWLVCVI